MRLEQAQRKRAKIKMGLQGPSGSGKTMGSLLVAFGLCGSWDRIAIIDSENHSASLYDHLGNYKVINLNPPFTPESYVEAIHLCEKSGIEVIIIDSLSHSWEYLLDYHSNLTGNSFTNWSKVMPRHNDFIQTLLQSPCHIIGTVRTKQDYVLVEKNNKQVPEKVGLKGIQKDGLEYDFTLVFDIDIKNNATSSKDRTGLFFNKPERKLSFLVGEQIRNWCNSGAEITAQDISVRIGETKSIQELLKLFEQYPQFQNNLKPEFETRKRQILINQNTQTQLAHQPISANGTH